VIPDQPVRDDDLDRVAAWVATQRPEPPRELRERGAVLARRVTYERSLRHRASVAFGTGTVALAAAVVVTVVGR
jgi:hypothetical protein